MAIASNADASYSVEQMLSCNRSNSIRFDIEETVDSKVE
jgi:hypothetical protein